jgi:GTPase SAR1 family protein
MQITRGKIPSAIKTVIYGPEGIGKSTFASKFPDPLFIDTEGSTKQMDVARLPTPKTWTDILDEVKYVYQHPECCKTLVVDTADWAEMLCVEKIFDGQGIESPGYGKGYQMLADAFRELLQELEKVIAAGIHVVLTAHAAMRKFEQPDEMGAYDRWEMKLQKKTAPIVKEWADMVLFCNYKTTVVNVDGQGATKGKNKVFGGERVIYTTHHNCWDAKNRFGLDDRIPMEFESISSVIGGDIEKPKQKWQILEEKMNADGVDEFDLQNLVGLRGWALSTDEISSYSSELLDFLLGDWEKVKVKIAEIKGKEEVPFKED